MYSHLVYFWILEFSCLFINPSCFACELLIETLLLSSRRYVWAYECRNGYVLRGIKISHDCRQGSVNRHSFSSLILPCGFYLKETDIVAQRLVSSNVMPVNCIYRMTRLILVPFIFPQLGSPPSGKKFNRFFSFHLFLPIFSVLPQEKVSLESKINFAGLLLVKSTVTQSLVWLFRCSDLLSRLVVLVYQDLLS